jgi:hypothetical protein
MVQSEGLERNVEFAGDRFREVADRRADVGARRERSTADQAEHNWPAFEDNVDLKRSDVQECRALRACGAYMTCVTTNEKAAHTEGFRLHQELCTTAGIPAN